MRLSRPLLLLATVTLSLTAAGCFGGTSGPGLGGREFLSVGVTEGGADRPLVPGTQIRLRFEDRRVSVQAGCNTMGADYEVRDGRLVADGGAMTEMGCDEPRHAQDDWLFGLIGSRPSIALSGNELALSTDRTTIAFLDREVAEPDLRLVGPVWVVESLIAGDAVSSVPEGVEATLQFGDDGRVGLFGGCNSGGATVAIDGDRIRFTDVVTTDIGCPGAAGQLEAAVLGVLGSEALTFRIDADRLDLAADGTGLQLRARAGSG